MSDSKKQLAATPKAFDVFKPGKTGASPTSRPVILGPKQTAKDTTLTGKSSAALGVPVVQPRQAITEDTMPPTAQPSGDDNLHAAVVREQVSNNHPSITPNPLQTEHPEASEDVPQNPIQSSDSPPSDQDSQNKASNSDDGLLLEGELPAQDATSDTAQIVVSQHAVSSERPWLKLTIVIIVILIIVGAVVTFLLMKPL